MGSMFSCRCVFEPSQKVPNILKMTLESAGNVCVCVKRGVLLSSLADCWLSLSPSDLADVEPNVFLRPFLEVVRSEDTTGPITGLALTSVNKFLSYGLLGKSASSAALGSSIFFYFFSVQLLTCGYGVIMFGI